MVYEVTACCEIEQHMPVAYYTEIVLSKSRKQQESYVLSPHCRPRMQGQDQMAFDVTGNGWLTGNTCQSGHTVLPGNITAEEDSILYRNVNALSLMLVD